MADINEIFRLVLLDPIAKQRLSVKLKDKEGDEVSITEITSSVTEYILDKLKDEKPNQIKSEIMPIISQAMVAGMAKLIGNDNAVYVLSDSYMRGLFLDLMMVAFALLKFIQKKDLSIVTMAEPVTEEEISSYRRTTHCASAISRASLLGVSPRDLIKEMLSRGLIREEDLTTMGMKADAVAQLLTEVSSMSEKKESMN